MKSRAKTRAKKQKRGQKPIRPVQADGTTSGSRLSLCMIVKDEAKHLGACLKSVKSAVDEIIVVDTGSSDATVGIAREHGAKVVEFNWINDFSAARNESIKHATGDYIIWLDADDIVEQQDRNRLALLKQQLPERKDQAFFVRVESADPKSGTTSFNQLRIFPNIPSARFEFPVHEQISHILEKQGIKLVITDITVRHVGNIVREDLLRKTRRNLQIINEELKKDADNIVMHFQAARSLANIDEQEQAVDHMQKVIDHLKKADNTGPLYFEAGLLMGRYYNEMGLFSSAQSILNEIQQAYQNVPLLMFELGKSYFLEKRFEDAIRLLEQTAGQDMESGFIPVNEELIRFQQQFFLAKSFEETGQLDEAGKYYEQSLRYKNWNFQSYHALGMISLKQNHYRDALNYLGKATEVAPEVDSVLYANLGLIHKKLKQYDEAEKNLIRAIEINPDRVEAFVNLGYLYMETGHYDKAASSFNRALKLDPQLWDVRLNICEAYFKTGQIEKLVDSCNELLTGLDLTLNRTLEKIEDLSEVFELIGDSFLHTGKHELAVMAFQTGFSIYPATSILNKLLPVTSASKRQQQVMSTIRETIERYADNEEVIVSVQGVLDQFQHTANYSYK